MSTTCPFLGLKLVSCYVEYDKMFDLTCMVAYVGPGAGLSMMGALLAVGGLLLFALLAPLIYAVRWVRSMFTRAHPKLSGAVASQSGAKP